MTAKMKIMISNESHSQEVQKALFNMGYRWGEDDGQARYTNKKFLFAHDVGYITYSDKRSTFEDYSGVDEYILTDTKLVRGVLLFPVEDSQIKTAPVVSTRKEHNRVRALELLERIKWDLQNSDIASIEHVNEFFDLMGVE